MFDFLNFHCSLSYKCIDFFQLFWDELFEKIQLDRRLGGNFHELPWWVKGQSTLSLSLLSSLLQVTPLTPSFFLPFFLSSK